MVACVASVSNRVIARKLERKQKKKRWKREGEGSQSSINPFFFLLSSRRSRRTRAETLATQAREVVGKNAVFLVLEGSYQALNGVIRDR